MLRFPRRRGAALVSVTAIVLALSACGSDPETGGAKRESPHADEVHCAASVVCSTDTLSLDATTLKVEAAASASRQTVTAELVNDEELHCTAPGVAGGALAIFNSTATDAEKTITYTLIGSVAADLTAAQHEHPDHLMCYGSPVAFEGFVDDATRTAVFVAEDELFEAALFSCDDVDTKPCFTFEGNGDEVTVMIEAPAGDPKVGPGP